MTLYVAIILFGGIFFCVESCYPSCDLDIKDLKLSDGRQYTCTKKTEGLNPELYHVTFEEQGTLFRCQELTQSDPGYLNKLDYPPAPEFEDGEESFAAAHLGGTMVVKCVAMSVMPDEVEVAKKGYILASDLKQNKKYACLDTTPKGRRMLRGYWKSC